ncbi:hypothetical protein LINPERPRIM_LOCUS28159 [Linum perenne]
MNPAESSSSSRPAADSSCYYPGCKKNANCDCDICLASINATLDLIPFTLHKSDGFISTTTDLDSTPLSFGRSVISTPISTSQPLIATPELKSTARALNLNHMTNKEKDQVKKDCTSPSTSRLKLVITFIFILAAGAVFSLLLPTTLQPVFTADSVRAAAERSWVVKGDLSGRLMLVQNQLRDFAPRVKVSNCSYKNSVWQINQADLLLRSECILYKSGTEEVKIWGWPLQTAGMIKTGASLRSFTVLSGRVTEWVDGKIGYEVRRVNSSWVQQQQQWNQASAVQMDPNTWVLEYSRSWMIDNPRVTQLAKTRVWSLWERLRRSRIVCSLYSNSTLKLKNGQTKIRPT